MKFARIAILFTVIVVLGAGLVRLWGEKRDLSAELKKLQDSFVSLKDENQKLSANMEYLQEPENLLKEVKSQFNYKEQGEKLIIIVGTSSAR